MWVRKKEFDGLRREVKELWDELGYIKVCDECHKLMKHGYIRMERIRERLMGDFFIETYYVCNECASKLEDNNKQKE